MLRTLPVAAEMLDFVSAGQPDPVMIWDDQGGRRVLTDRQETDDHTKDCPEGCQKHTGERLWTAYVMPTKAERPEVLQVRVRAPQQPTLTMFGPVALDNLEVNVRVDKSGKLAQYWSAASIRDAGAATGSRKNGHQNGHQEHKPEGQPA